MAAVLRRITPEGGQRAHVIFALILVLATAVLSYRFTQSCLGVNDALFSIAARNHLRYGYAATRLGFLRNVEFAQPSGFNYYTHHPPLLPVAVSGAFALLGEHGWAARLVPIAFSLGSLILVYLLGGEVGSRRLGLLAAFFFALVPMNAFFGRMVGHEAPTNFFALGGALFYLRWHRSRQGRALILSLAWLGVGMGFGWPAYYLAGLLPIHHLLTERHRRDPRVALFPVLAIAMFGLDLAHIGLLRGEHGSLDLARAFLRRAGSVVPDDLSDEPAPFALADFLKREGRRSVRLFTLPVVVLAACGLYERVKHRMSSPSGEWALPILLLVWSLVHVVLFRQGAWSHPYWTFYCSAPLALLAAHGGRWLAQRRVGTWLLAGAIVVFVVNAAGEIRARHGVSESGCASIMARAAFLRAHTASGELILTNQSHLPPNVRYYADRDGLYGTVRSSSILQEVIRRRSPGRLAFVLSIDGPGADELDSWLSPQYAAENVTFGGRTYRVFHIEARDRALKPSLLPAEDAEDRSAPDDPA